MMDARDEKDLYERLDALANGWDVGQGDSLAHVLMAVTGTRVHEFKGFGPTFTSDPDLRDGSYKVVHRWLRDRGYQKNG